MPAKSVREMNKYQLRHYSLEGKTFHMVFKISVFFAVLSMIISVGLFIWETVTQTAAENVLMAQSTITVLEQNLDVEEMGDRVLKIFRDIPEEVQKNKKSTQYRSYFRELENDPDYQAMEQVLRQFKNAGNVKDIYMVVWDDENHKVFYVADPDRSNHRCETGDYEEEEQSYIYGIRNSTVDHPFRSFFYEEGFTMITGLTAGNQNDSCTAVLVETSFQNILVKSKNFVIFNIFFLAVFIVIIGRLATRQVKKRIVDPLNQLSETAKNYVEDKTNGDELEAHFINLRIRTGDEIEILSNVMSDMEKELNDHEKKMEAASKAYKQLDTEIAQTADYQQRMLPALEPDFIGKREYELFATVIPEGDLSESFYDFFMMDADHIAILIGNVSECGILAAGFMSVVSTLIRTFSGMGGTPAEILANVDRQLSEQNPTGITASVWFAVIGLADGHVWSCNAGNSHPAIMKNGEEFVIEELPRYAPVGSGLGAEYAVTEFDLDIGDRIFLYTRGITNAEGKGGERFGTERMLALLNSYKKTDNETTILLMGDEVKKFTGNAPLEDDMTMLGFTYRGIV